MQGLHPFRHVGVGCLVAIVASIGAARANASVIHVPADHATLKAAIAAAANGDEIVVADGTYAGTDNRALDFGGKAVHLHSANGAGACIIDCELVDRAFVFQSGETSASILEGFTITNAKPAGAATNGGAILVNGVAAATAPIVRECVFVGNAAQNGGAIAVNGNAQPLILECTFQSNVATAEAVTAFGGAVSLNGASVNATIRDCAFATNSSGGGGAIHRAGLSVVTIDGCTFLNNSTNGNGGAISLTSAAVATVMNCRFAGNTSGGTGGGAVFCTSAGSNSTVVNCLFSGNKANSSGLGGGLLISTGSVHILNCTMAGNAAGAVNLGGAVAKLNGGTCIVHNSILWGNAGQQIQSPGAPTILVEHTIVQGGFVGEGNLATDPALVDLDGADDVLGTLDDDLRVSGFSPAIDSGSNVDWNVPIDVDVAGLPRFYDEPFAPDFGEGRAPIIDRGAHESQPAPPTCVQGDLDCDGDVDAADLGILLGAWGSTDDGADLDDDGAVTASDLALLLGAWG
jgi:predicted outer membrane repeat protein